jgi:hypothetical protein
MPSSRLPLTPGTWVNTNMETEAARAVARAGQLAKDQGSGLGRPQLGVGATEPGNATPAAQQEVPELRPTSVAGRGKGEWRGAARDGNKANLSPNLCLSSHSMLAGSPDSPRSRLRSREGGEGEGGAWQPAAGRSLRESLASNPPLSPSNLTINLSHIYLFFLKFPSLPHNEPP